MGCEVAIFSIWQRCGSTLLQRMAARRPGILVWGETGRWINHFGHLLDGALDFSNAGAAAREAVLSGRSLRDVDDFALLANMAPDPKRCAKAAARALRVFFDTAFWTPWYSACGFKEVRITNEGIRLFVETFVETQVVLLVRDPVEIWRSVPEDWVTYSITEFLSEWNAAYEHYRELDRALENVHLIHFEDVVARDQGTVSRLARAFRIDEADIIAELEIKGVSSRRDEDPEVETVLRREVVCDRYRSR